MNKLYLVTNSVLLATSLLMVGCSLGNRIANLQEIYASAIGNSLYVAVVPTSNAVAGTVYKVDLLEKGKLRDTKAVRWNQPEINANKSIVLYFPLSPAEHTAYGGKELSGIFTIDVHQ